MSGSTSMLDGSLRILLTLLLSTAVGLLHAAPAESRDLFVSTTGDDSTAESWESAYLSIGRALSEADPGDAVHVAAGAYIESVTIPVGVSLIGGHPPYSSGSVTYNRNPSVYITTIGTTEDYSAIRMWQSTVLDGFSVFGRIYQTYEGGPVYPTTITIRTCRIEYEHSDITYPAISSWMPCCHAVLIMEECFVKYSTEQPSPFMSISVDCRIVNTIFSYDLPLETAPMLLAGGGPSDFVNCVIYDRGRELRPNGFEATQSGFFMSVLNSISNQRLNKTSFYMNVGNSIYKSPFPLGGNRDVLPQFVDPDNDDFRLHPTSPAIDMGRVVETLVSHRDFLGRPRVVDIPGVGKSGNDAIDIGAYEMQLDEYRLRSDLNWDGGVDWLDLLIFSQDWHRGTGP